jgi:hypothetical protein
MSDPNDLSNNNSLYTQQSAPLDDAGHAAFLARLIEVENAIKANTATTKAQGEGSTTDKELLDRVKTGERWMICITILVFLVSCFQAYESWTNNKSTGVQVDNIITAANRVDNAADSFSKSAAGINGGVASAVSELHGQADESRKALQATTNNFHREQRAYLIPGDPEDTSGYGLLRFPIINFGHTTASHLVISTHFERIKVDLSTTKSELMDRRVLSVRRVPTIPPSDKPSFYMMVFIPQQGSNDYRVELANGTEDLLARGTIQYDSGFGESDTIPWCYGWKSLHARWENCGGSATAWLDSTPNTHQQVNQEK